MTLYYDGHIVHQSQSDHGMLEVIDAEGLRSLHFGTFPRQSSMSIQNPHVLALSYTQAMMASLLLNPNPKRVLVVGLGGGSLVRFLLHHFEHCKIDVVELREDVVKVAYGFFNIPNEDDRLSIFIEDGYQFVQSRFFEDKLGYDLILIDAYHDTGIAETATIPAFFDACSGLTTPQGVMSINLWGTDRPAFKQTMHHINQSYDNQSLTLPVVDKGNVICLASASPITVAQLKKKRAMVDDLEFKYGIDLPRSLRALIRYNRGFGKWLL